MLGGGRLKETQDALESFCPTSIATPILGCFPMLLFPAPPPAPRPVSPVLDYRCGPLLTIIPNFPPALDCFLNGLVTLFSTQLAPGALPPRTCRQ